MRALAREREARGLYPYPLRDGALRAKKRTDALAAGAALLAGAGGVVVPMERVLNLYIQPYDARYPVICVDRTAQTAVGQQAAAAAGPSATYDYTTTNTCGAAPAPSGCSWSR